MLKVRAKHSPLLPAIAATLVCALPVWAEPSGQSPANKPLAALTPGAQLVLDAVSNTHGGIETNGAVLGRASIHLDFDSERGGLWNGARGRFSLLGTFGESPSALAGDLQVTSNVEAPSDLRVFEAWVEQSLGPHASLLAGYHDFNAEFDVASNAADLLNSSFGVGPDISQVGPSIFPRSYPGARLRLESSAGGYALAGAWRGLPFAHEESEGSRELDGTLLAAEGGWERDRAGEAWSAKLAIGVWQLDASTEKARPAPRAVDGAYLLAEGAVLTPAGMRVGMFLRVGRARDERFPVDEYLGVGMKLSSFSRSRPNDVISIGIAHARLSPVKAASMAIASETAVELNWKIELTGAVALVPDVQYVVTPAGAAGADDAFLLGLRTVITIN